jgi:hypothetical protein
MSDPVELSDSIADSSIEVVGTVSPGASPYQIKVSAALQTAISTNTSAVADHETRIDALEAGTGTGDVDGPGSSTDNAVARFDGTTGKVVQNSVVTIADSTGNMAGVGTLNTRTIANWVDGPASVTDGRVVAFDGTTGKLVKQDTRLAADLAAGPASATDNAIVRFDGTTGKLVQNSAVTVADTTGSIDNTSGSGTMTSTRFIGPATKLRSASTDIDVSSATAPSSGQVLMATSSTAATWQTLSSPLDSEWWGPEESPDALNEEMITTPSMTMWDCSGGGGTSATSVSPTGTLDGFNNPSVGAVKLAVNPLGRRSWAVMQGAAGDSRNWYWAKQVTLPADTGSAFPYIIRARLHVSLLVTSLTNNAGNTYLTVCKDNGSNKPTTAGSFPDNMIRVGMEADATSLQFQGQQRVSGTFTGVAGSNMYSLSEVVDAEFVLVKLPGAATGWECWVRAGSWTIALTQVTGINWGDVVWVGVQFSSVQALEFSCTPLSSCDYIRFNNRDRYFYR